jgi:iron uptake system component EfeO
VVTSATAATLALGTCAMLLAGCADSGQATSATTTVRVSILGCGDGWRPTRTGTFHLTFSDTDTQNGEVRIVGTGGPRTPKGAVFADIEPLAARSSANLDLGLGPGHYAVQCLMEASSAVLGPDLHLTGGVPANAVRGVTAVTLADLVTPIREYQAWVSSRLPGLRRDALAMRAALAVGDRAAAKAAWFGGHAEYERLGAAYQAFGSLDASINGLPYGLSGGTHDPGWTGFHAIESGLWGRATPQRLVGLADRLVTDVDGLAKLMALPPEQNPAEPEIKIAPGAIDALTFSIRAHEIAENSLQFSLTGKDDFGAHASLAAVAANLDGTVRVLEIVAPLLAGRIDRGPIEAAIATARAAIAAAGPGDVRTLPQSARERVDAAISQLTELLAPVAVVLEPRRAS